MTSTHPHSNTCSWPSGDGRGDLVAAEPIGQAPPGSLEPAAWPPVIRYQLRYPAQVAFAASRPGSMTRIRDATYRRPTEAPVEERKTR